VFSTIDIDMKIVNKEVIQSYLVTSAKYNFSAYEKRIMYRIIEIAQADLKGKKLDRNYTIDKSLFDDRIIKMDLSAFKKHKDDKNYVEIKKALTALRNKTIEYETDAEWKLIGIIEKPKVDKYSSFATFEVQPEIWSALLKFDKGYSKYELEAAMSFNSVYAMRFFELFSNNMKPMTLRIDDLKERFGISEKYIGKPANFIKRVVDVAKSELDKKSEYSFNYKTVKEGRKITMVTFIPKHIPSNKNPGLEIKKLQKKVSLRFDLSQDLLKFLNDLGFTHDGVRNNLKLFKDLNEHQDLYGFLKKVSRNAEKAKNPQGYIIAAMRTALSKGKSDGEINTEERAHMTNLLEQLGQDKKA